MGPHAAVTTSSKPNARRTGCTAILFSPRETRPTRRPLHPPSGLGKTDGYRIDDLSRRSLADGRSHALGCRAEPREDLRGKAFRVADHGDKKVLGQDGALQRGLVDDLDDLLRLRAERDLGRQALSTGRRN